MSDPHDLLKYLYLSAQSHVACSLKEIETNSRAEFVMFSQEQEASAKVKGRRSLKDAYAIAEKFQDKFSHDFNWENQKLDFDEAIILFTKQQIEKTI